ncbi:MAG: S8 family serine peptidase, partial [Symbiobacteriaceae bacterium]|nr:S8 family serine peptidase [Symbiobacteriaceae bacterium]
MQKRFLSILLALAMVISCITPLYAGDINEEFDIEAFFAEANLEALNNLDAIGEVEGLYGFTEMGISLDDNVAIPVIVVLNNKPAPVAAALEQPISPAFFTLTSTLEEKAADDKAVFYSGLAAMFNKPAGGYTPFAPAYAPLQPAYEVIYDFDTTINGVALTLPADRVAELLEIESVAAVFYNVPLEIPEFVQEDALAELDELGSEFAGALNTISSMSIGIPEAHAKGYKGANVVVGVIDTGADYLHPDLIDAYFWYDSLEDVPERWQDRVWKYDKDLNPNHYIEAYQGKWAYFGFNGFDAQFYPYTMTPHTFPKIAKNIYDPMETTFFEWRDSGYANSAPNGGSYYNNHGTHCSGIIVGRGVNEDRNVLGVAPEAKLISYRLGGPGGSSNIAAAIMCVEEGVKDGVDIFSFSYGDSYARGPYTPMSLVINYATIAYNVIFTHSAGNDYLAYTIGGPDATSLTVEVGSTSYTGINVVFGANGSTFDGNLVYRDLATAYSPQANKVTNQIDAWILKSGPNVNANTSNEDLSSNFYIMPQRSGGPGFNGIGTGVAADWTTAVRAEAAGKIVVVARGTETLTTIPTNAKTYGAAGVVIIWTPTGTVTRDFGTTVSTTNQNANYVPMFTMTNAQGLAFVDALRASDLKGYFLDFNGTDRGTISSFSSRGPVKGTFEIKPDVVTPGSNILSTLPWYNGLSTGSTQSAYEARRIRTAAGYTANAYGSMSGTSMAGPYTAGLMALIFGEYYRGIYADLATTGAEIEPLGGQPNPYKQDGAAFEVKARLANTASKDFFTNKNFGVHEVGSGSPNVVKAIESSSYITADREVYIPIGSPDYRFFEDAFEAVQAEVTSFSFGGGNLGTPDEAPRVITGNIHNASNESKEYAISFQWNRTSNRTDQNVKSNGKIPLLLNGTLDPITVTVAAGATGTFNASMQIPDNLVTADVGSHEGYIIIESGSESYHLPFALTVLEPRPYWYLAGLAAIEAGEEDVWFEIRTHQELEQLSKIVDGRYGFVDSFAGKQIRLLADMDLSSYYYNSSYSADPTRFVNYPAGWNAIGVPGMPFEGTFDGNGYSVRNLRSRTNTDPTNHTSGLPNYKGLFGVIQNATLLNVVVESGLWNVSQYAAGVVGYVTTTAGNETLIKNCINRMPIVGIGMQGRLMYIGGIVGYAETEAGGKLTIEGCSNYGNITGAAFIGGILGGTAMQAQGEAYPGYDGTLVGPVEGDVLIKDCYNYAVVQATVDLTRAGGIAGYLETRGGSVRVENSGNHGRVHFTNSLTSGTNNQSTTVPGYAQYSPEGKYFNALGGVVGISVGAEIIDSYNVGLVDNATPLLMFRTTGQGLPMWP